MRNVSPLSIQPGRFRDFIGVRAAIYDSGHIVTKPVFDIPLSFRAAAIFHGIMQKCADRLRLVRAVLERDRGYAKDMRDVRDPRLLSRLLAMRLRRVH